MFTVAGEASLLNEIFQALALLGQDLGLGIFFFHFNFSLRVAMPGFL